MYIQSSRLRGRLLHYVKFFLFYVSQVAMQVTGRLRLVPMHLYWSLAWSLVSALLYIVHAILCIHFSIHTGCDPASDWSLVIEFHVVLLVACMVACRTIFLYFLSASVGDCASDLSLVIEFYMVSLVACMVACMVACRIVLLLSLSAYAGDCASDWSLAIDFYYEGDGRLCGRLNSQGFAGKVILGESDIASSSDRASAWSLALFLTQVRVVA